MQIDMHHSLVYILARLAGFSKDEANIVSYSSQYVDDATNEGTIYFDNKALFHRIASAHKMIDYRNFRALANHRVWIPFHFLPGNEFNPKDLVDVSEYVQRLICRPNSEVAKQMVRSCIEDQNDNHSLHRLGITLHTYADTWAHQGFAGIDHEVNSVQEILDWQGGHHGELNNYVKNFFGRSPFEQLKDKVVSLFLDRVAPVGHGCVLGFPDRPYLKWKYKDWRGQVVERDNPKDFLEAADHMYSVLLMYRAGVYDDQAWTKIPEPDREIVQTLIETVQLPDGRERHYSWLRAIYEGRFSFGAEQIDYQPKGRASWKHLALGTLKHKDDPDDLFHFDPSFLESNWKLFHDALIHHRYVVLHEILPQKELCAA